MNSGKTFCIHRDRVIHAETYTDKRTQRLDHSKTFVNFLSPGANEDNKNSVIFATVDMSLEEFRDSVLNPAYSNSLKEIFNYE